MTGWALFTVGGLICALNAYLSWLRYPLHRWRGGSEESYRHASGVPWIGSLLVVLSWAGRVREADSLALDVLAWLLIAMDTGGLHWFVLVMLLQALGGHGRDRA